MEEVKFINHKVNDCGVFRISYANFMGSSSKRKNNVKWTLNQHIYPYELTREESHKLLSFIIDESRRKAKDDESMIDTLIKVDKILPSLGFTKVPFGSMLKPVELFIVEGEKRNFTHTKDYQKYFNWYQQDISKEEAGQIFDKMKYPESFASKRLIR